MNNCDTFISVVIPIFNEQDNLPALKSRLSQVLEKLGEPFEVVFVNDGSSDKSIEILRKYSNEDQRYKIIDLSRNFGHQAALYAGICRTSGKAIILMDGDLQDPPEILPELVKCWRQGNDVVYCVRRKRKEGLAKRAIYSLYYRLLQNVAYVNIPLDAGDFGLMDQRVALLLRNMPERNKFLRGLRSWVGFRQTSVFYERDARYAGKSKYSSVKLMKLALDGLISYSYVPLRVCYIFGFLVSLCSFFLGVAYLAQKIFSTTFVPQGFTTIAILILFLGGLHLITLGLIGEYVGRIYDEVKRRPEYIERETVGFETED